MKPILTFLASASLFAALAAAQTSAVVNVDANTTAGLPPSFSGVNADLGVPVEYWDYRFNTLAAGLGFSWVRFPGGASSDIYSWQEGQDVYSWWQQFPSSSGVGQDVNTIYLVAGRGGARLVDAADRASMLGAPLIICVNGFTDTPQSAGQLAAFVKQNNIQVAAWELSNEPYLYTDSFFPTATAYLDQMYPFYQAIHAVDPNAVISIFIGDQGHLTEKSSPTCVPGVTACPWNQLVESYSNKYWNAVSFHSYSVSGGSKIDSWIADEIAVLATRTGQPFLDQLKSYGRAGVQFINSEFDPSIPTRTDKDGKVIKSLTDGTLWGGVFAAEYIMRNSVNSESPSAPPTMLHVGPSEISHQAGVLLVDNDGSTDFTEILDAGKECVGPLHLITGCKPIDTLSLDFGGFYPSAQGVATSVVNNVLTVAIKSDKTTVTGGPMVAATNIPGGVQAIYAMSYTSRAGRLSTVITNKSASPQQVTIKVNGASVAGVFPVQYACSTQIAPVACPNAPDSVNTAANQSNVIVQSGTAFNPLTIPAYSVMRVDLETPPVLTFLNGASMQNPGAVYQWSEAAPDEQVVAILPTAQSVSHLYLTDASQKQVKVDTQQLTASQVSFTVPEGLAQGPITVSTTTAPTLSGQLDLVKVVPGIYSANGNGAGVVKGAWNAGSGVNWAYTNCNVAPMSCLPQPIPAGALLQILGTGFRSATNLQVIVAGTAATVVNYGAYSSTGVDQVTLVVPPSLTGAGNSSVYIVADGSVSNRTTIEIQ